MQLNRQGATRTVILTRRHALKIAGAWTYTHRCWWRHLLHGLLANMQERAFSKTGWPELCPVVFCMPGGWFLIMRRARIMTAEEFEQFDHEAFCARSDYTVPAERKADSFGYLDGRIVAVDYGS